MDATQSALQPTSQLSNADRRSRFLQKMSVVASWVALFACLMLIFPHLIGWTRPDSESLVLVGWVLLTTIDTVLNLKNPFLTFALRLAGLGWILYFMLTRSNG